MQNVKIEIEGQWLIISVDLSKVVGPSKSGKTIMVATTGGNVPVDGHPGVHCGVNVYKSR